LQLLPDDTSPKTLKDSGYDVKAITRTDRSAASIREQVKARG
jgi:hypothetical protein